MTIGKVIRKYRKEKGLTQEEMAIRLGVSTPAVKKWEKDNTLPDISLLVPIARLFGISTDELLSFKDDITDKEIDIFIKELDRRLKQEPFEDVLPNSENEYQTLVFDVETGDYWAGASSDELSVYGKCVDKEYSADSDLIERVEGKWPVPEYMTFYEYLCSMDWMPGGKLDDL